MIIRALLARGPIAACVMLALGASATLPAVAQSGPNFDACAAEAASQYEPGYEATGMDTWNLNTTPRSPPAGKRRPRPRTTSRSRPGSAAPTIRGNQHDQAVPLLEEAAAGGNPWRWRFSATC